MHREIFHCEKTPEGYEELYKLFKETGCSWDLDWVTWQLEDERFFTKGQAFELLYFFINKYSEDVKKLELDFSEFAKYTKFKDDIEDMVYDLYQLNLITSDKKWLQTDGWHLILTCSSENKIKLHDYFNNIPAELSKNMITYIKEQL